MAKKTARKGTPRKSAEGLTKQAIIVQVYKANPDLSTKDAVAKIKADYGVDVAENYYQVTTSGYRNGKIDDQGRSTGKEGKPARKTAARKTSRSAASTNGEASFGVLKAAQEFATQHGSFEEARQALVSVGEFLAAANDDVESATEALNALESLQQS